jgi:hypothetical protein
VKTSIPMFIANKCALYVDTSILGSIDAIQYRIAVTEIPAIMEFLIKSL